MYISKMDDINKTVNVLKNENEKLRQENTSIKQELSNMSVKLDSLEGLPRRNNLRFLGIEGRNSESWDDSERKVRDFISNTLGLTDLANVEIERAHRVGSTRSDSCPIIAKFTKYKDRESVLRAARQNLSSKSQYSVREDYTERVQLHRRELTKTLIEARNQGKYASLRFDKLIIDGDTYMYIDTDDTIKRIGSSRSRGRVGANNGLQRLDASREGIWLSGKTLDCRPRDCEFDPPSLQLKLLKGDMYWFFPGKMLQCISALHWAR